MKDMVEIFHRYLEKYFYVWVRNVSVMKVNIPEVLEYLKLLKYSLLMVKKNKSYMWYLILVQPLRRYKKNKTEAKMTYLWCQEKLTII